MDFGGDEVEPLLHAVAIHRACRRGEARFGFLVGQVLHDGRAFGEHLAVVELQGRQIKGAAFAANKRIKGAAFE